MLAKDLILLELKMLRVEYPFMIDFKKNHSDILRKLRGYLNDGKSLKSVKSWLIEALKELYYNAEPKIKEIAEMQHQEITDSKIDPNMLIIGLTLREVINNRISTHYRSLLNQYNQEEVSVNKNKSNANKALISIVNDYTKSVREQAYAKKPREKYKVDGRKLKGFLSVGVIDKRTSNICIKLNNVFYPISKYKKRSDIPNLPPRHPNCRTLIVNIYKDDNIKDFEEITLTDLFKEYPNEFKRLVGSKKYDIMRNKKITPNDIFDKNRTKFLTIKEIEERF